MRGRRREEEKSKTKSVFCNTILKVTSQHFCLPLVLKSKWLGLAHSQGKGLPKSMSTRRQRSLGDMPDSAYHSTEEWRGVCLGGEKEMLGAVEDPEILKSFAKFAQVLWRSAFLTICRTLLQPMLAVFSLSKSACCHPLLLPPFSLSFIDLPFQSLLFSLIIAHWCSCCCLAPKHMEF